MPASRMFRVRSAAEWARFWKTAGSPAPAMDLHGSSILIALGRPGSAEVSVESLVRQGRRVTATLSSPRWPQLDLDPGCRPFSVLGAEHGAVEGAALLLRETASSRLLDALVKQARQLPPLPRGDLAALSSEKLELWKESTRREGDNLLARVNSLVKAAGSHRPFAVLLQARVVRQWMGDETRADTIEAGLEKEFAGTLPARVARAERPLASSRALDRAAWPWLESRRLSVAALPRSDPERGSLLLALGLSYEHAHTLRPLSLLVAARCYQESGLENGLFRAAEIHDLWFDRREARRCYWQLVEKYPRSGGVITCLARMAAIEDSLAATCGTVRPFRAYLAAWPRGPHAAAIRRRTGRRLPLAKPTGRRPGR